MTDQADRALARRMSLTRRRFLAAASTVAGGTLLARRGLAQPGPTATPVPATPWAQQGQPLSRVGDRSPFVEIGRTFADNPTDLASWSYTPLQHLDGIITPSALHFERNHAGVPIIDPAEHRLVIHGLVDRPLELTMDDLRRFPGTSRIHFLECSGNSFAGYEGPAPEVSAQDLHGLTSTSDWSGVSVRTLLEEAGVRPEGRWVLAEGADAALMTRSVPIDKMMDDALVAYGQNGEPLRPEQGYPIRLFLPGWEGNANIKWLRRLEVGDAPFMTREETSKYTDLMPDGQARQFTYPMGVKSVITFPSVGHHLPAHGPWEIRGIAWSGRGRIERVEVSTDGGATWEAARLDEPVLPIAHTRFRFPWTWGGDSAVILSRAADDTGAVQPTREELVSVRGEGYVYHFNGIQPWRVNADGTVTNAMA